MTEEIEADADPCGQSEWLAMVFAVANSSMYITAFIAGVIYDKFGTRTIRLIAQFCIVTGSLILASTEPGQTEMFVL